MALRTGDARELNVILFVLDTLRADRMGCYGYFRDTCPAIDRFASEGAVLEDFHCTGFSTGNAFTCIHTGLPAIVHRYYATPASAFNLMNFDDRIPTLAEAIQSTTGHTTVAVDNLINFAGHMKQTVRGYTFYLNPTRESGFPHPEYNAGDANELFLPWLETYARRRPFFAFVHYWDVHQTPYQAPGYRDAFVQPLGSVEGLPVRKAGAGYDYVPGWGKVGEIVFNVSLAEKAGQVDGGFGGSTAGAAEERDLSQDRYDCALRYLDSEIARVRDTLDRMGALDRTLIIITSDHGEGLGNHGIWGHGLPYEDTVFIPLIVWRPGLVPAGARVRGFCEHMDLAPTILDLLGFDAGNGSVISRNGDRYPWQQRGRGDVEVRMEGRSLRAALNGDGGLRDAMVTEVRRGPKDPGYRVWREGPWKLVETLAGRRELYDLASDPMEKADRSAAEPARCEAMSAKLRAWVASHLDASGEDPMRIWPLPPSRGQV